MKYNWAMPRTALVVVVLALSGCEGPLPPETVGLVVVDKAALSAMELVWEGESQARVPVRAEPAEDRLLLLDEAGDEVLAWLPVAHVQLGLPDEEGCEATASGCSPEEALDEECSAGCRCALTPSGWSRRDSLLVAWSEASTPGRLRAAGEGAVLPRKSARFCATTKTRELAARFAD